MFLRYPDRPVMLTLTVRQGQWCRMVGQFGSLHDLVSLTQGRQKGYVCKVPDFPFAGGKKVVQADNDGEVYDPPNYLS